MLSLFFPTACFLELFLSFFFFSLVPKNKLQVSLKCPLSLYIHRLGVQPKEKKTSVFFSVLSRLLHLNEGNVQHSWCRTFCIILLASHRVSVLLSLARK